MDKKINILSVSYLLFLVLLFLSGMLTGIVSEIVYFSAFLLPLALALFLSRADDTEKDKYLGIGGDDMRRILPLIAPTVSVIIIVSFITSLVIYAITGKTNSVDVGDSFVSAMLSHALLPAILEEALFRYLPLRLIAPRSKRAAVLVSAFFFSLVHHNLFSIPYAFIAGLIFMAVDLAADSVVPSVLIHFINNAFSVGLIFFADNGGFAPTAYTILAVITVLSIVFIIKNRKYYKEKLFGIFKEGEGVKFTPSMLVFAAITLTIAVISLL